MPDLKLDPLTGDLALINGDLALTDDASGETVLQRLRIRLRMFRGEWFLDTRLGVPFLEYIFVKNPDMTLIESALRQVINETQDVARIVSYRQTLDRASRTLSVTFRVETTLGQVVGDTVEIGP